jgi:hypothetical protein
VITDGINEPPQDSPYYNPDGILKHEYLERIDDYAIFPEWKVQILSLGEDPGKYVFWQELTGGSVTELPDPTSDKIEEALEVIGEIKVVKEKLKKLVIRGSGKGTLIIPVTTDLYDEDPALIINDIVVKTKDFTLSVLPNKYTQILPANSISSGAGRNKDGIVYLRIPVNAGKNLNPGDYKGQLDFTFDTDVEFVSPLAMGVHVNNVWQDNPWLLLLLVVIAIILLVVLVFGIIKLLQGHPIKFKIIIDEMPLLKGKDTFKISKGKNLFLLESMDFIRVSEKKNLRCFAKLAVINEDLKLTVLKEKNFPEPKDIPENVLEATIVIITDSGKKYHTTFSEIT